MGFLAWQLVHLGRDDKGGLTVLILALEILRNPSVLPGQLVAPVEGQGLGIGSWMLFLAQACRANGKLSGGLELLWEVRVQNSNYLKKSM